MSMWFMVYSYDWKKCLLFKTTWYYTLQILHSRCLLISLTSLHHSRVVSLFYLWLQRSSSEKKKRKNTRIFTGNVKSVILNCFLKILFNFFFLWRQFLNRKSKIYESCFKGCTSTPAHLPTLGDTLLFWVTIFPSVSLKGNLLISTCLAAQIITLQVCAPCLTKCSVHAHVPKMSVLSHAQNVRKTLWV